MNEPISTITYKGWYWYSNMFFYVKESRNTEGRVFERNNENEFVAASWWVKCQMFMLFLKHLKPRSLLMNSLLCPHRPTVGCCISLSLSLLSLTDSPHQLGLGVLKLTERRWLRPEFLRVGSVWVVWLWLFTPLGEGVFLFFKWLVDSTSFDHGSFASHFLFLLV